jgi:hypothetical protein
LIIFTAHAEEQIRARNITRELVLGTIEKPQQTISGRMGRRIYQSRYFDSFEHKEMLVRVIIETEGDNLIIISTYKSSKLEKFWLES